MLDENYTPSRPRIETLITTNESELITLNIYKNENASDDPNPSSHIIVNIYREQGNF